MSPELPINRCVTPSLFNQSPIHRTDPYPAMSPLIDSIFVGSCGVSYPGRGNTLMQHPDTKGGQRMTTSDTKELSKLSHYDYRPNGIMVLPTSLPSTRYNIKPSKQMQHRIKNHWGIKMRRRVNSVGHDGGKVRVQVSQYKPLVDTQGINDWWERKVKGWTRQGRLTDDGTLRLADKPPHRICHVRKIRRLWSHLSTRDAHELVMHMYGPSKYRLRIV